ncbi:aldo/keto reductase [Rothia aerolata]|uniref:Oxidoreductase n=1 Tax=Rothia aerolata TaxID=1812262 RepID=A0A917IRS8_9MICC|nr:aldo/keto reductase [Rothia aerolata]GGH62518.1 oxidoreductase [Rothia aerolata]
MTYPSVKLNDGRAIPQLGFGVWQVENDIAEKVVGIALDDGYRHIDTAKIYGNEEGVGKAIAASSVDRDEIWLTTKVWNDDQGYDRAIEAFNESLARLGVESVDLLLIHWVSAHRGLYLETWKALIELQKQGKAKSIGVSNFPEEHLREIIDATGVTPAVNQIELHPYFNQAELRKVNDELGIKTEAWSPLGQGGEVLKDPVITEIAETHSATSAQVIIAWHLANGIIVFPKSVTEERIASNFKALELKLSPEEIEKINGLTREDGRIGADPATADF